LAVTYLGTLNIKAYLFLMVLFTGRERGGKSRIHSKKILIRSWLPTNIIPVTATLDRVNTALAMFVSAEALAAAARNKKKKKSGVPNSTRWQENFSS
jgi:ribosomal protein L28